MRSMLAVVCLVFLAMGCDTPSRPRGSTSGEVYAGISTHIRIAVRDTNMDEAYKAPPAWSGEIKDVSKFELEATWYLQGVEDDLRFIDGAQHLAQARIEAVEDAVRTGVDVSFISSLEADSAAILRKRTNFKTFGLGYHEFPSLSALPPIAPVDRSEFSTLSYRSEVLNYLATAKAYVQDGLRYVDNCTRDADEVRRKGKAFAALIDQLSASGVRLNIWP